MLRILTGKPGSGKSYYAVHSLLKDCTYDPVYRLYEVPPGMLLMVSLEGLRANAFDIEDWIKKDGIEKVFSVPVWQEITKQYGKIKIVIDEAQRYFPSFDRTLPNSVWYFFEYHRHLGIDLTLITQDVTSLHRRILNIAEVYIEATPSTLRVVKKIFRYATRDVTTNMILGHEHIKTDQRIFGAYKSAVHAQGLKAERSPLIVPVCMALAGLAFTVFLFYFGIYKLSHRDSEQQQAVVEEKPLALVPSEKPKEKPKAKPKQVTMRPQYDEITAADVSSVIPESRLATLPPGCSVNKRYVICQSHVIAPELARMASNRSCVDDQCTVYIPRESYMESRKNESLLLRNTKDDESGV